MREYPKMLYRAGTLADHHLCAEPIKIAGKYDAETLVVHGEAEELAALEAGWSSSVADTVKAPALKKVAA